jgi:hypothetical protein
MLVKRELQLVQRTMVNQVHVVLLLPFSRTGGALYASIFSSLPGCWQPRYDMLHQEGSRPTRTLPVLQWSANMLPRSRWRVENFGKWTCEFGSSYSTYYLGYNPDRDSLSSCHIGYIAIVTFDKHGSLLSPFYCGHLGSDGK